MEIRPLPGVRVSPIARTRPLPDRLSIRKLAPLMAEWRRRRRFRGELRRLLKIGPHMIEDIGLDYREALEECEKPFWRP